MGSKTVTSNIWIPSGSGTGPIKRNETNTLFVPSDFLKLRGSPGCHGAKNGHMTHLHERHDSLTCVTWLILVCDMTHPHVKCSRSMTHSYMMCNSDMTHSHGRHDSLTCVTWLILVRDVTHSCVKYNSDTTHSCVIHGSLTRDEVQRLLGLI